MAPVRFLKQEPDPWELRRGAQFVGAPIPSGARVDYRHSLPAQRTGDRFDPAALPRVLVGYHINPGGRWSGEYYVVDLKVSEADHDARY